MLRMFKKALGFGANPLIIVMQKIEAELAKGEEITRVPLFSTSPFDLGQAIEERPAYVFEINHLVSLLNKEYTSADTTAEQKAEFLGMYHTQIEGFICKTLNAIEYPLRLLTQARDNPSFISTSPRSTLTYLMKLCRVFVTILGGDHESARAFYDSERFDSAFSALVKIFVDLRYHNFSELLNIFPGDVRERYADRFATLLPVSADAAHVPMADTVVVTRATMYNRENQPEVEAAPVENSR